MIEFNEFFKLEESKKKRTGPFPTASTELLLTYLHYNRGRLGVVGGAAVNDADKPEPGSSDHWDAQDFVKKAEEELRLRGIDTTPEGVKSQLGLRK